MKSPAFERKRGFFSPAAFWGGRKFCENGGEAFAGKPRSYMDGRVLWERACPRWHQPGFKRTGMPASAQTLNRPTSICKCVPNRASSTLEAAVSSLAAEVCSDTSRTFSTLRLISSATALCCSAASEETAASSVELARLGTHLQMLVGRFKV